MAAPGDGVWVWVPLAGPLRRRDWTTWPGGPPCQQGQRYHVAAAVVGQTWVPWQPYRHRPASLLGLKWFLKIGHFEACTKPERPAANSKGNLHILPFTFRCKPNTMAKISNRQYHCSLTFFVGFVHCSRYILCQLFQLVFSFIKLSLQVKVKVKVSMVQAKVANPHSAPVVSLLTR